MKIASEGFLYIALFGAIALVLAIFEPTRLIAIPFALAAGFVAFFFRDPNRVPPDDPELLVSAADGRVVYVGEAAGDPSRQQVDIFLSPFDVHINRSPISGVVAKVQYTPGSFLAAYNKQAGTRNERNEIELVDEDYRVTVRQIAGVLARRIVCKLKESDRIARGERFGLIQFGSRTEIVVPRETELRVKVGDRVKGGESVIGKRR